MTESTSTGNGESPRAEQPLWKLVVNVILFAVVVFTLIGISRYRTIQSASAAAREATPSVYTFPDDPIADIDHHTVVLSGSAAPTSCQAQQQSRLSTSLTESAQRAVKAACDSLLPIGHTITVGAGQIVTVTALCHLPNGEEMSVTVNRAPVLVGEKCG